MKIREIDAYMCKIETVFSSKFMRCLNLLISSKEQPQALIIHYSFCCLMLPEDGHPHQDQKSTLRNILVVDSSKSLHRDFFFFFFLNREGTNTKLLSSSCNEDLASLSSVVLPGSLGGCFGPLWTSLDFVTHGTVLPLHLCSTLSPS